MFNKNTKKGAFLSSLVALILCCSMFIGTTFAWFTDEVKSGNNIITAGNLDIELEYAVLNDNGTVKEWKTVNGATELFTNELWEPGHTEVVYLKMSNKGTLALKYQLGINIVEEVGGINVDEEPFKLSEHIRMGVVEDAQPAYTSREAAIAAAQSGGNNGIIGAGYTKIGDMKAGADEIYLAVVVYMPEEVGNEANYKTGTEAPYINLGINVYASQETVEKDSFDQYYDDTASYPENRWLGDIAEELVIDVENKIVTISTGAELAKLAEIVNSGVDFTVSDENSVAVMALTEEETSNIGTVTVPASFEGYTVKLTNHIDLGNIAWTPIGTSTNMLKAEVDGQGYTIYNLKVSGTDCVGLFGCTYTDGGVDGTSGASITDVHVVNADVTGNHWVGAIVGKLNYGNLTNCSVTNAEIVVVPDGTEDDYDNGDKVGGIAGFVAEGYWTVSGNTAENVYLKGYRDIGGIVGIAQYNNTVEKNTVKNIEIVVDQATNAYGDKDFNAGGIVGRTTTKNDVGVALNNNAETDVTISYVVGTATALKNAIAMGGNVTLGTDVDVSDEAITIATGNTIILDLNGHIVSATNTRTNTHNFLFDVKGGTLSIKNGAIEMEHTGANMGWSGATTVIDVTAGGVLNLENVTVENLGGTDMNFAIHMNNWGSVTMNANNCVFKAPYCSVRVYNSGPDMNNVKITNSTLTGNKMAFWVHNYDSSDLSTWYYSDGTKGAYDKAKVDARLNLDIYGNNNSFVVASDAYPTPIRYGFNEGVYFTASGALILEASTTVPAADFSANGEDIVLTTNGVNVASFSIPSEAIADSDADVVINIEPTTLNSNIAIEADDEATTYEITVSNIAEDNKTPIKVELQIGANRTGVKVYHKVDEITDAVYNPNTGWVTFYTTSFSPYTVVYDADSEYVAPETEEPGEDGQNPSDLPVANVVRSTEYENIDLEWGSYGQWSPTSGLDSQLEAAYTFTCTETLDEAKASPYANWYCDFYVMLNKDLDANQIFLGGNYGSFGWVGFHNGTMTLDANTEIALLGSVTSNPWTYVDVVQSVGTFICGVGDVDDALTGATFTVMLRLTNPDDTSEYYNVSTISYTFE